MADDPELTLHLTVTGEQGAPRVPLKVSKTISSSELRRKVSETTRIPATTLRLIFRGRLIGDDDSKEAVAEFKLEDGSVLHCMGKPVAAASAPAVTSAAAGAAAAAGPTSAGSRVTIQASAPPVAPPVAAADPLKAALQTLRSLNSPADYQTAVTTLDKILSNIVQHPLEEKYRRVKKQNAAFQRRLGGVSGGDAAMKAAGFEAQVAEGEEFYMMQASADAWARLVATKATVEGAVRDANAAASHPTAPPQPFSAASPGIMPNFGNAGAGSAAGMHLAMANLLSDPNELQAIIQNPMVQQMMRSDPRMANNPMLQHTMQEIASNPAAASQMSEMLRDPAMMRQMQTMMQSSAFGGGMSTGGLGIPAQRLASRTMANGHASQTNRAGTGSTGASDEEMTEEEMIAEAIRRSLQDE